MSDPPVAETTTFTTRNKRKGRTSMPSLGFELAIPAIEQPQTYVLDRTSTGIGGTILPSELDFLFY